MNQSGDVALVDALTLTVRLNEPKKRKIIYLTDDKRSWLEIAQLPDNLIAYSIENYEKLFSLHPPELGKIIFFNSRRVDAARNEAMKHRYHSSYLNTPKYSQNVLASFMFSGYDESKNNDNLPEEFEPYYSWIRSVNANYNQAGINWYKDGHSFIPNHVDCEAGMIENYSIAIINLNEPTPLALPDEITTDELPQERMLTFKPRFFQSQLHLYNSINIVLTQGVVITMHGDTQKHYKHGIKSLKTGYALSRIGLSFRQFKQDV